MVELERRSPAVPQGGRQRYFWRGLLALIVLTAIWGYCNVVIKELESAIEPALFLMIRYLFVGLLGMPLLMRSPRPNFKRIAQGLAVGVLLAAATLFQAIAMKTIAVDNVAFITALYVVLTPLAMALWRRRKPHRVVALAALVSLLGVGLLVGHLTLAVAAGTLWALFSAIWATLQIIGTAEVSRTMTTIQLTIIEALGAGLTLVVYLAITSGLHAPLLQSLTGHWPLVVWWRLGFLSICGTLVAGWLQVWGQRQLTATEAALTFNLEPVWTALFAWFIFSQWLSWLKLTGAALIIASLIALSVTGEETAALEIADAKAPYREH
ncbi:MAG: EamA family transporter [Sulfobacillus acidophilus]|uniref:EamA family transporter n=1 Tax=Sulfobacillus acidophilus TaxID=53633 RepID=A0A2T2WHA8_9FIRM|nr:MAG: EamA family transporter [Sulfobacillus acidophilus]